MIQVKKAEYALEKLKYQGDYLQNFYSTRSQLAQSQLSNNQNIDSNYYNRYQDVIEQQNWEKQQAEAIRQYNETMAYNKAKDRQEQANWERNFAYQQQQDALAQSNWEREFEWSKKATSSGGGSSRSGSSRRKSSGSKKGSSSGNGTLTSKAKKKTQVRTYVSGNKLMAEYSDGSKEQIGSYQKPKSESKAKKAVKKIGKVIKKAIGKK